MMIVIASLRKEEIIMRENNRSGDGEKCSNNSEAGSTDDNNKDGDSGASPMVKKSGTLDDGTTAFMQWLDSENKHRPAYSSDTPIILRKFIKDKHTILYDKNLESEVDVEIKEGVPFCRYCDLDDCSHVGFTVSLEQMCEYRGSNQELSVDDIIDS
jgi:hypothetical protein